MNKKILKLLLAGEYLCSIKHRQDFDLLDSDAAECDEVNAWLMNLGMCLERVGDEGAFYMGHDLIGPREITQVKVELVKFRDEFGPAVLMLDFIRQTDAGQATLSPGEVVVLHQLEAKVTENSMLDTQLKALLPVIANAAQRMSVRENLRKLMDHLAKDGYVVLANKDTGAYHVTGKIEQLYAVLQFLDENKVIPDAEVDDRDEVQDDLVDQAADEPASGEEAPRG